MSDRLRAIQRDMAFMGWKGEAATGFHHKEDVHGNIVAWPHDLTWWADFREADERAERLERRGVFG